MAASTSSRSRVTTDHDEIRRWVEARGGRPARVRGTGRRANDPGLLRIDYPGFSGERSLEPISWDRFFKAFDDNKLAFVYQDGRSRFSKLVARDTVQQRSIGRKSATSKRRSGAKRTTPKRGSTARRGAVAKRKVSSRGARGSTSRGVSTRKSRPSRSVSRSRSSRSSSRS